MKEKKFVFDLDCKISIYVPSTINVNDPCDNTEMVKRVIRNLSELFGGATASDAVGGWITDAKDLVIEKVKIVYSFCSTEQLKEHFVDVYNICESIKNEMKQEAVTLEVNGQVKFV